MLETKNLIIYNGLQLILNEIKNYNIIEKNNKIYNFSLCEILDTNFYHSVLENMFYEYLCEYKFYIKVPYKINNNNTTQFEVFKIDSSIMSDSVEPSLPNSNSFIELEICDDLTASILLAK